MSLSTSRGRDPAGVDLELSAPAALNHWLRPITRILFCFLILLILRSAWLSEDSYIGWRTVDNFVQGHGLRWNLLDRVQVFTDPLFILLMSPIYAVTHEIFVLEINTMPGFTSHSLVPKAAEKAGVPFTTLCDRLAKMALRDAKTRTQVTA